MMHKIDFAHVAWESPMEGMRQKKIIVGDQIIRLVEYTKRLPFHWCEKGHAGYVIDGELEIQFDASVEKFSPGDCILIPDGPDHKHAGKAMTDTVAVFFVEKT
jgi:quercetin dioxygenase-like cupin family protein